MQKGPVGRGYSPGVARVSTRDTRRAMQLNTARLLKNINDTVEDFDETVNQFRADNADIQVGSEQIEAAISMYGDESGYLSSLQEKVNDPSRDRSERAEIGRSVSRILGMQVDENRYQDDRALDERRMGINERRLDIDEQDAARRGQLFDRKIAAADAAAEAQLGQDASASRFLDWQIEQSFPAVMEELEQMGPDAPVNPNDLAGHVTNALGMGDKQAAAQMIGQVSSMITPEDPSYQLETVETPGGKAAVNWDPRTGEARLLKIDASDALLPPLEGEGAMIPAVSQPEEEAQGTAQEEAAKVMGKEAGAWVSGGKQEAETSIANMRAVLEEVKQGKAQTGFFSGLAPDAMKPQTTRVRDDLLREYQKVLRATLGAQFTENEAKQFFKRAWNDQAREEDNIKRIEGLIADLEKRIADKNRLASQVLGGPPQPEAEPTGSTSTDKLRGLLGE